jgi:Phage integrase, N-terminal SAM-like domain
VFSNTERLALAGFLAGYSGLTRQAYELDLRQDAGWCQQHQLRLFHARRPDIECFVRDLEAHGRARATITRRLCTVAGFYRYVVEEELLDHSPAAHARRLTLGNLVSWRGGGSCQVTVSVVSSQSQTSSMAVALASAWSCRAPGDPIR